MASLGGVWRCLGMAGEAAEASMPWLLVSRPRLRCGVVCTGGVARLVEVVQVAAGGAGWLGHAGGGGV